MEPTKPSNESLFSSPAPLPIADLDDAGRLACLRLIRSLNVGPVAFRDLINHYGGAKQALDCLPHISSVKASPKKIKICSEEDATAELEAAHKIGATPVFTIEPGYPKALANLSVPPPLVYTMGDKTLLQKPAIAIVGARLASAAGIKLARIFASELGRAGLIVVSGLARGIDHAAHEAALDTGTIAVVAGGLDVIYPPEHEKLHHLISQSGCLVSEMPCGFKPRAKDFPRRNRIISGLSLGVLVVEAARRSGSLVTARLAGEQNRELFAIPGHPLDPRARGTNDLLKNNGAMLVTQPDDIVQALKPMIGLENQAFREPQAQIPTAQPEDTLTNSLNPQSETPDDIPRKFTLSHGSTKTTAPPQHKPNMARTSLNNQSVQPSTNQNHAHQVRQILSPAPIELDAIVRATGLGTNLVRAALLELELNGEIERHGSNLISLKAQE